MQSRSECCQCRYPHRDKVRKDSTAEGFSKRRRRCWQFRQQFGVNFLIFLSFRLVLSRFEFEGVSSSESPLENGEDEEEVWLFWRDANKETRSKSIRELAQDAKEGQKEDQDVLSYYRYLGGPAGL